MNILIGADLVPTDSNMALFMEGNAKALLGEELNTLLQGADCRIFNLEVPLTDECAPILKYGPALCAPTAAAAGYKALGVDILTLANNHIFDQGEQGLKATWDVLNRQGIRWLGAGCNPEEAAKPVILELDGKKIGIYACVEHEFSIVSQRRGGANPADPLETPDHVAALKGQCDYVIVLYHGGLEHYRYPSPNLQRMCRKLVEKGADLVLCQHSHCIGCMETYGCGTIVYGQGNFLFDDAVNACWDTGLLVQILDNFQLKFIPVCKNGSSVRLAEPEEARGILGDFAARGQEIQNDGFLAQCYEQKSETVFYNYLAAFSGVRKNLLIRIVNKLSAYRFVPWLMKKKYGSRELAILYNYLYCEAHWEQILCSLRKRIDGNG